MSHVSDGIRGGGRNSETSLSAQFPLRLREGLVLQGEDVPDLPIERGGIHWMNINILRTVEYVYVSLLYGVGRLFEYNCVVEYLWGISAFPVVSSIKTHFNFFFITMKFY